MRLLSSAVNQSVQRFSKVDILRFLFLTGIFGCVCFKTYGEICFNCLSVLFFFPVGSCRVQVFTSDFIIKK